MHELSIAQSILDTVRCEQGARRLPGVIAVGLRIGALSGVLPDALQFAFEALVTDTPLAGCRLVVEHVPVRGACRSCGGAFVVEDLRFVCPQCGGGQVDVVQGFEMDIAYLEIPAEEPATAIDANEG